MPHLCRFFKHLPFPIVVDSGWFAWCKYHGLKSLGPEFDAIQDIITSTRLSTSLDACARRILESTPSVLPTSLATFSHGVPTVRFAKSSLPWFTASAIAGGTSGNAWSKETSHKLLCLHKITFGGYRSMDSVLKFSSKVPVAMEAHDLLATRELTCLALN